MLGVVWDLGSLTRDGTHVPCVGRKILNPWTTREVPLLLFSSEFLILAVLPGVKWYLVVVLISISLTATGVGS